MINEHEKILRRAERNLQAQEIYAHLLRHCDVLFSGAEIQSFAQDCRLSQQEAYCALLAAACGLESDRNPLHRQLADQYLTPALRQLKTADYRQNAYYRKIQFPDAQASKWQLTHLAYAPFQLFPCGDTQIMADGREIQPLGYFEDTFFYPAVLEDGREWMTITPNEIETMSPAIAAAFGNTAVFGLGLGYYAFMISEKENVTSVTIIERDAAMISLFRQYLMPQFPHKEKIRILQADAFDHLARATKNTQYDFAFVDLWHDAADGLPLYLRCRRLEKYSPKTHFHYWIEPSLLLFLKGLLIEDIRSGRTICPPFSLENLHLPALRALAPLLSPDFL